MQRLKTQRNRYLKKIQKETKGYKWVRKKTLKRQNVQECQKVN